VTASVFAQTYTATRASPRTGSRQPASQQCERLHQLPPAVCAGGRPASTEGKQARQAHRSRGPRRRADGGEASAPGGKSGQLCPSVGPEVRARAGRQTLRWSGAVCREVETRDRLSLAEQGAAVSTEADRLRKNANGWRKAESSGRRGPWWRGGKRLAAASSWPCRAPCEQGGEARTAGGPGSMLSPPS